MSKAAYSSSFESQLLGMIGDLLKELAIPSEQVEITSNMGAGMFLTVTPRNTDAAAIHLHFDSEGGSVDFNFGHAFSTFELDGDDYMPKLRTLAKAVMEGRCGETEGFTGRTSWLEPAAEGGRVRSSTFFYFRLWPRGFRFAPYSARLGIEE